MRGRPRPMSPPGARPARVAGSSPPSIILRGRSRGVVAGESGPGRVRIARPRIGRHSHRRGRYAFLRRPPPLRSRRLLFGHPRRGPGLLRPAGGLALREFQRRHLADSEGLAPGVRRRVRLLPVVGRPGRRGRRHRPRHRAARLVAGRAAGDVRGRGPTPRSSLP